VSVSGSRGSLGDGLAIPGKGMTVPQAPDRAQYRSASKSLGDASSARDRRTTVVRRTSRTPRSIRLICTTASPELAARSSCVQLRAFRAVRTLLPNVFLTACSSTGGSSGD
jgi:hypothetical protein